jgi:hypothetical protein
MPGAPIAPLWRTPQTARSTRTPAPNGGSARVIHSLSCPVGGRPASPRKSQSKSQRRPTSGDAQLRQATVKPGQVPTERHRATSSDARNVTGGSRGRRFISGRPDAGQKADSKSGVGLPVRLGTKIDSRSALWRFLTGGQGVAVRMGSCRPKTGQRSRTSGQVPLDLPATTGGVSGLARGCLMRSVGAFELIGPVDLRQRPQAILLPIDGKRRTHAHGAYTARRSLIELSSPATGLNRRC